jgi:hypothetical protein
LPTLISITQSGDACTVAPVLALAQRDPLRRLKAYPIRIFQLIGMFTSPHQDAGDLTCL